jgi:hypothetical protein
LEKRRTVVVITATGPRVPVLFIRQSRRPRNQRM